jgi:transcriptional regulator NrdR family protein
MQLANKQTNKTSSGVMKDSGVLDNVTMRRWARGYRRFERMSPFPRVQNA